LVCVLVVASLITYEDSKNHYIKYIIELGGEVKVNEDWVESAYVQNNSKKKFMKESAQRTVDIMKGASENTFNDASHLTVYYLASFVSETCDEPLFSCDAIQSKTWPSVTVIITFFKYVLFGLLSWVLFWASLWLSWKLGRWLWFGNQKSSS
jgi:hypothetical protein